MNNRIQGHLVIVMAIEHYNPLSVIRSLGKMGINPVYIAIQGKGKIASSSKYISERHYAASVEEAYTVLVEKYGQYERSPFIICTDDKTIGYLDEHYLEIKDRFLFFNAGEENRIQKYMDKYRIIEAAQKNGLATLNTTCVDNGKIPDELEYPVITKSISPLIGGWKSDVFICENRGDLEIAFQKIKSPKVVLQKYIDKKNEYCLEGFSINHGKDVHISISTTYNYVLTGYYSPFLTVGDADNKDINKGVASMINEIGFEGVFEAEFLVDSDGSVYFDEINFRNSPWSYPAAMLGQPIPQMWMESMIEGRIKDDHLIIPENYTAMIEPVDYAKRVEGQVITEAEWLYDFKKTNVTFYYDKDDPDPFFVMMRNRRFYS